MSVFSDDNALTVGISLSTDCKVNTKINQNLVVNINIEYTDTQNIF